jgi:hypothetical protein
MGSSSTHPIFENVSQEIVVTLASDPSDEAKNYRNRALDLLHEFKSWATTPPDTNVRAKTVQAILDLHREVQEYRVVTRTHAKDPEPEKP